jgi:hypothetical protein
VSHRNERPRSDAERLPTPAVRRPADCTDEEFARRLWAETDRSLAEDERRYGEVRRWVVASAGDQSWSTAGRAGLPEETGLRAYVPDASARAAVRAAEYRENARREKARRGWATRRDRAQPRAPARDELS